MDNKRLPKILRSFNKEHTFHFNRNNYYPFKEVFIIDLFAAVLLPRTNTDMHVSMLFLNQDDGCWYEGWYHCSSFYLKDQIRLLSTVNKWLNDNCTFNERTNEYYFK